MAALSRESDAPGPVITGFTAHGFRCDGEEYRDGLLLTPEWARVWDAPDFDGLDRASFGDLIAIDPRPEFLLLGTGEILRRPSPRLVAALEAREIGIEPMDSRAAARSWGMLRGEGRWIVAALLPFD